MDLVTWIDDVDDDEHILYQGKFTDSLKPVSVEYIVMFLVIISDNINVIILS